VDQNLRDRFYETAARHPAKTVITYRAGNEWRDIDLEETAGRVRALSAFLKEKGIKKDDKAAILMENRPEWAVVFFAVISRGAVCVPLDHASGPEETGNILKDAGCDLIFTSDAHFALAEEVSEKTPIDIVSADSDAFRAALKNKVAPPADAQIGRDDLACLLYTSGTTAVPKGVMLSHGNLLANCASIHEVGIITDKDSVVSVLPLHHAYPLTATMIYPLLYACRIIYPASMRGEDLVAAMKENGATSLIAVPQVFHALCGRITDRLKKVPFPLGALLRLVINLLYKLRNRTGINLTRYVLFALHKRFGWSLRAFISGGAKLDEDIARTLFKLGFTILEGYGLTETSPILTMTPLTKPKIGSVGVAVPGVEIEIENMDKRGIGEVVARGGNIMKGYYNRKDLTDEAIKAGWFHTGDLGYMDGDRYLYLTGRIKEMLVLSSGVNIYPEEIEEAYLKQAPVKEMCVFEAPSREKGGENIVLWAVVVPDLEFFKKYSEINLKNVIKERFDNVSRSLAPHKRIMGFSVTLEDLPRTVLGKIKRFAVKEIYASGAAEEEHVSGREEASPKDLEMMESEHGVKIADYLKGKSGSGRTILPGDLLELDIGVDSLGRIEMSYDLEKMFNIQIDDDVIGKAFTVKDLIAGVEMQLEGKTKAFKPLEKDIAAGPDHWKDLLAVPPREENLRKIDLKPGPVVWLGCFLFLVPFYLIFKLFFSLKVEGKKNVPEKGPYVLYVNHTSYMDGFLVGVSLPHFPRLELFFVGFRPFFTVPVIRHLIKIGRIIPLDFSSHLLEALRSCWYVLKNGKSVCLFPEGLRTLDGNIGEFKKGFGILSKESKIRLIPVIIEGAYEAWPRTARFPHRHPITVRFGEEISPEEMESDNYEDVCRRARDVLVKLQAETRSRRKEKG